MWSHRRALQRRCGLAGGVEAHHLQAARAAPQQPARRRLQRRPPERRQRHCHPPLHHRVHVQRKELPQQLAAWSRPERLPAGVQAGVEERVFQQQLPPAGGVVDHGDQEVDPRVQQLPLPVRLADVRRQPLEGDEAVVEVAPEERAEGPLAAPGAEKPTHGLDLFPSCGVVPVQICPQKHLRAGGAHSRLA